MRTMRVFALLLEYSDPSPVIVEVTTGTPAARAASAANTHGLVSNAWTTSGRSDWKLARNAITVRRSAIGATRRESG